jgi:serpin B
MGKNICLIKIIIALATTAPTFAETTYLTNDVSNWEVKTFNKCILDTTKVNELRKKGADEDLIWQALQEAKHKYYDCFYMNRKKITFNNKEVNAFNSANKYSTDLFGKITKDKQFKDKNVIFSPTSMQFALAMVANGTDDNNTYDEITTALGNRSMPLDELNEMYKKRLYNLQNVNNTDIKIGIANALFLKKGEPFGKVFLDNINQYYKATSNNVDFNNDSTYTKIDEWAKRTTDGMIPSLGITPNRDRKLMLTNALCFHSDWEQQFDRKKTKSGKFTTSTGKKMKVTKMNGYVKYGGYAETSNYQLTGLKLYEDYKMIVILPKEGVSIESVLTEIDLDNIQYKEPGPGYIYCTKLSIPKFSTDMKIKLKEICVSNGLESLFKQKFNNIAKEAVIQSIDQCTHLEIDEDGVKASAITNLVVGYGIPKLITVEMDVNRPFIITIQNEKDHEILFIGLINDPTAK